MPSDYRTLISDLRTFGLQNLYNRNLQKSLSDLRTFGLQNLRNEEPFISDSRTFGLQNLRTKRLPRNISIIIIGVIYHPPPPAKDGPIIAHITRSLEFLLQRYPAAGVLLLGDFNKMRTSRVTGSFHLKQIVDKPTRKGAILDKILTNMADFYPTPEICSHLGKSDHNIITAIPCLGQRGSTGRVQKQSRQRAMSPLTPSEHSLQI